MSLLRTLWNKIRRRINNLAWWLVRLSDMGDGVSIVFKHDQCGTTEIMLGEYRIDGPEFQCFHCRRLVPKADVSFSVALRRNLHTDIRPYASHVV